MCGPRATMHKVYTCTVLICLRLNIALRPIFIWDAQKRIFFKLTSHGLSDGNTQPLGRHLTNKHHRDSSNKATFKAPPLYKTSIIVWLVVGHVVDHPFQPIPNPNNLLVWKRCISDLLRLRKLCRNHFKMNRTESDRDFVCSISYNTT